MEYDGDNEQHRTAYDAAFSTGEKIAEEKYDSDDITLEYGYDTTIEIICRYTDEDGNECTESKEIDVSEYMSDVLDLMDSWNADEIKEDCNELRDEYVQTYAERYADEHWTEYLPKEDETTLKIKALEADIETLKAHHDKICQEAWNVENLKLAAGNDAETFALFKGAQGLLESARDIVSSWKRKKEAELEELKAEQQKEAEQPSDGLHETQAYNEEAQEAKQ